MNTKRIVLDLNEHELSALEIALEIQFDIENDTVTDELYVEKGVEALSREQVNERKSATEARIVRLLAVQSLLFKVQSQK